MPLYLCGEMASEPLTALAVVAVGYRALSMPPGSLGPVKEMVRSIDLADISAKVNDALDETRPAQTMMEILMDYTDQRGIPV